MATPINGQVVDGPSLRPLAGLRVEAWAQDTPPDKPLGTAASTGADGTFSIALEAPVVASLGQQFVFFRVFRAEAKVADTQTEALWSPQAPDVRVVVPVHPAATSDAPRLFAVQGTIATGAGVPAAGAVVDLLDDRLGGPAVLATGLTDANGRYSLLYDPATLPGKARADLSVRVRSADRPDAEVARSAVLYQATPQATVRLLVDAAQLSRPSEYQRLLAAVQPMLGRLTLARLDAQGVAYLAARTGWDARAVAMAALAAQLSAATHIPAEHHYALLRAGLPADAAALGSVPSATVTQALRQAIQGGVIANPAVADTLKLLSAGSADALRLFKPVASVSNLGSMLAVSLTADQSAKFLETYHATAAQPALLWDTLAGQGFDAATVARLQTDGKLGFLTRQNAPLVQRLRDKAKVAAPEDLVSAGLYKAAAWTDLIGQDVPAGIALASYAAGLAAQVRLGYPTLVVAEMLHRGELPIEPVRDGAIGEVAAFLRAGNAKHRIGADPVKRWDGFAALSDQGKSNAKLVERLYQLSPSNESMQALHTLGLQSAADIARITRPQFLARFGAGFPDPAEAALVYNKAQDIHSTTLSMATMYLSYRGAPNAYAMTGAGSKQQPVWPAATPGAPTLESLLDSMDYCACDECGSVLGAAAYYVDLLRFIDVASVPAGTSNPLDALLARRPDLQDLLLSCENTNVALPYIDLVNEVLEHFIVNGSLAGFHGHNMSGDSNTADLLADPQFVVAAAYDKTKAEVYPFTLPFDMPLAALRLLMQAWNTTLADSLRAFGMAAATRQETLLLSATEFSILTDSAFRPLPAYFGEPDATGIDALNAAVANGKTFSHRTGITYEELVGILGVGFVNPGAALVPLLQTLAVPLPQLLAWSQGTLSDAGLTALLPPTLDPAAFGGDVLQWLHTNIGRILGLITLTDTGDGSGTCDFAQVELRFARPNATNQLTALEYQKLHRFIRLWKKLGWGLDFTGEAIATFCGIEPEAITLANIDSVFADCVARIAGLLVLSRRLSLSEAALAAWLPVWDTTQTVDARQATLARLLRMGTTDLLHLSDITGVNPLADDLGADAPSLLRFLDARDTMRAATLKVVDLDYLLRDLDGSGTLAPTPTALLLQLKALRDGITGVNADLGARPADADLAYARNKMALVYDPGVLDRFLGLFSGGTTYSVPLVTTETSLPAKLAVVDPHLAFDPFGKRLTSAGILAAAAAASLAAAADTLVLGDMGVIQAQPDLDAYIAAVKAVVGSLADAGQADLQALALHYPELKAAYDIAAPIADPAAQAAALIDQVIPALRGRLQAQALRTSLASQLKTDPDLVAALTGNPAILHAADPAQAVIADFLALDTAAPMVANGIYALHLDPPATDDYLLFVAAPPGTTVGLSSGGVQLIPLHDLGGGGEAVTAAELTLQAGGLWPASVSVDKLPAGGAVELRWQTKGMAKAAVPAARVYLDTALDAARDSLLRLQKAAALLRAMPLTSRELTRLAAVDPATAGFLNDVGVGGPMAAGVLQALWGKLAQVVWFAGLKAAEPEPDTWAGLLDDPAQVTRTGTLVLAAVGGWAEPDLNAVLGHFGLAVPALSSLAALRRVKEALDFVGATGQAASDLLAWTTPAPDAALIDTIKQGLRARQDPAAWRTTLQSVNDALRNQRRDALVSFILYHQPPSPEIDTGDKLYEYFLIDVAMDACMQTSRIRLALSTVQMFIARCLMNLEPTVAAAAIDADQWAWMKRYRVWQANREIFLYPENWLEPELRDDKSPFFTELESELMKSDITDDLAEDAYLDYLKKLDEVARLEVIASFLQEGQPGADDDILHVFGRTNGVSRQYWYRRFEGGYWTPWDKMSLNIEGDVILPVIWKSQLFVFWMTMVHKPQGADATQTPTGLSVNAWNTSALVTAEVNLAWGEYYKGKWTSPKSSELKDPMRITGLQVFEPQKLVAGVRTETPNPDVSERLVVTIFYMGAPIQGFTMVFTSKNAAPKVTSSVDSAVFGDVGLFNYILLWEPQLTAVTDANSLVMPGKGFTARIQQPNGATTSTRDELVLTKSASMADGFRVRTLTHPVTNQFEAPLFYSDERSTLFIQPDERIVSIAHYNGYFWNDVAAVSVPPAAVKIPPLYEKPILKDPAGPVESVLTNVINPAYGQVINGNQRVVFGGASFDARGIAAAEAAP